LYNFFKYNRAESHANLSFRLKSGLQNLPAFLQITLLKSYRNEVSMKNPYQIKAICIWLSCGFLKKPAKRKKNTRSNSMKSCSKKASCLLVTLCLLLLNQNVLAWGAGGHMMVAHIAYARLNPKAKAEAKRLIAIKINPEEVTAKSLNFINAAHWPDDLRPVETFAFSLPLHFIDQPFSTDGTPLPTDLPDKNIVTALKRYVAILKSNASDEKRAEALRFIIHFVGDIHQPLHCATQVTQELNEGDRGGNLFKIRVRDSAGKIKVINLHSYWDGGIGNFPKTGANFAPPPQKETRAAAAQIRKLFPASDTTWKTGDPFDFSGWANESEELGKSVAYADILPNRIPNKAYNSRALETARKRVAWGGYRLAELLNAIWTE
jgi:hypothetical protein